MKKPIALYQGIIIATVLMTFFSCSVRCKYLSLNLPCGDAKFIDELWFPGFTIDEVKNSVLHYYKPNDNFRERVQTVKFSDARQVGEDGHGVFIQYQGPANGNTWLHSEYDWLIVMQGRAQPFKVTKFKFGPKTCCVNDKPVKVSEFISYELDGVVKSIDKAFTYQK
jgi:hypothetical protein